MPERNNNSNSPCWDAVTPGKDAYRMLKWLDRYYIGKGIKGSVDIQSRINSGRVVPGIWLITLSDQPGNLLEIVPAALLSQKQLYDSCPLIVGMAGSKKDAIAIVQRIVEKTYKKTGAFDLKDHLLNR